MDYQRLFEESPAAMYIYDRDTYAFIAVNRAAERQYGYTREEFLQMTLLDIRPTEEYDRFINSVKGTTPTNYDFGRWIHQRKDGSLLTVQVIGYPSEMGGRRVRSVLAFDISDRVKAEREIEAKNAQIQDILTSITDGFCTVDRNWRFTYINKSAERMVRRPRSEMLGRNIWEVFPEARAGFESYYRNAMHGQSVHFETYYEPLDMWAAFSVYPTSDGIAIYFVDITTQIRYLKRIEKQNERFREIAQVQAHEVRGPLSNVLGLADLIRPCDDDQAQVLELLKAEAQKLDEVIRKLSREAGNAVLDEETPLDGFPKN